MDGQFRQLARGSGLAGTLQARHQNHRRRHGCEIQRIVLAAHQFAEFAMHDADQCLARRQAADDFLADCLFPDARDEVLHHRQCNVRLE